MYLTLGLTEEGSLSDFSYPIESVEATGSRCQSLSFHVPRRSPTSQKGFRCAAL